MENIDKALVHDWIKRGHSHKWISNRLIQMYPEITKGLSFRSVRRFCDKHNLKKLSPVELDELVDEAVQEVYTLYGKAEVIIAWWFE